ncbi:MAG: hypothetical protein M0T85_10270 [Dehalococcoidales bacterium]|nr:hypothetical protein [Dehalococcoidales bacterium]
MHVRWQIGEQIVHDVIDGPTLLYYVVIVENEYNVLLGLFDQFVHQRAENNVQFLLEPPGFFDPSPPGLCESIVMPGDASYDMREKDWQITIHTPQAIPDDRIAYVRKFDEQRRLPIAWSGANE